MALLMPDINLRRAKHHLERYWRKLVGGDRPDERKRLPVRSKSIGQVKATQEVAEPASPAATGVDSVEVATGNLELDSNAISDVDEDVDGVVQQLDVELDCGLILQVVVKSNGGHKKDDERSQLNQVCIESAAIDYSELLSMLEPVNIWKLEAEQPPSSTSTTGTSSSVGSEFAVLSAESTTQSLGKPPLSRPNRLSLENMPQPKYASLLRGPTLGSILQRVRHNDGDVSELDFSTPSQRNKRLESEGCALVARSLSTNRTVRKLVIRDHAIGDDGAIALSKMLCNNSTLEHLDLYGNQIGDRGAEALAQALYGHDSLTHLCLNNNRISDRGAEALAQAIRCSCTLRSLEIVENRITRVGAKALLDALDVNIHLETVNLQGNNVPPFVASQLAVALARNRAQSLILESHAAEKRAVRIVRRASGLGPLDDEDYNSEVEEKEESEWEDAWEDDDGDSVSSGFLSCSGITDVPISSSGLWI